jgi:hypothetical protein
MFANEGDLLRIQRLPPRILGVVGEPLSEYMPHFPSLIVVAELLGEVFRGDCGLPRRMLFDADGSNQSIHAD